MSDDKLDARTSTSRGFAALATVVVLACGRKPEPVVTQAPGEPLVQTAVEDASGELALATAGAPGPAPQRRVRFRDGSKVLLATAETDLELVTLQDRRIVTRLLAGAARFEISQRPSRVFRVLAAEAVLDVSGTTFELERQRTGVLVRVLEGRVRVAWPRGQRQLGKGQQGLFPPERRQRE